MSNRLPNDDFADWLRDAMRRAGYPTDGPRAGGRTRLAADAGVSLSAISRALNEGRTPEVETLIRLAKPLRTSLRDLLIASGKASADDLPDDREITDVLDAIDADATLLPEAKDHFRNQYLLLQRVGVPSEVPARKTDDEEEQGPGLRAVARRRRGRGGGRR